jgi:hypothetical protein
MKQIYKVLDKYIPNNEIVYIKPLPIEEWLSIREKITGDYKRFTFRKTERLNIIL